MPQHPTVCFLRALRQGMPKRHNHRGPVWVPGQVERAFLCQSLWCRPWPRTPLNQWQPMWLLMHT